MLPDGMYKKNRSIKMTYVGLFDEVDLNDKIKELKKLIKDIKEQLMPDKESENKKHVLLRTLLEGMEG